MRSLSFLRITRLLILPVFLVAIGCGGIEGTAMQGIDDQAMAKINEVLAKAQIDRKPEAIKDLGDHWLIALAGGSAIESSESINETSAGDEGDTREESGGEVQYGAKPLPPVDASNARQVIVTKSGELRFVR